MDIKTFTKLASSLPPPIAILMRGPTGVGKSHLARALADDLDLPFLDVRGSTMDESQVSGIPDFETSKTAGVATFCLPSWYVRSCREPVVLMLDELNRSMPQVMQSFFQIVLDRQLGNNADGTPLTLHPDTRVIAAVNHGAEYDVAEMDPALLRRFWVVDLDPTVTDWIDWAGKNDIDPLTIDFIRQHPEHFRVDPGSVEPGTVIPTPASWHRLDESLRHMGMAPSSCAGGSPEGFYALATGFDHYPCYLLGELCQEGMTNSAQSPGKIPGLCHEDPVVPVHLLLPIVLFLWAALPAPSGGCTGQDRTGGRRGRGSRGGVLPGSKGSGGA